MAVYYPDFGTQAQVDAGEHVRAVGWLSSSQPFTQGDVPSEFVSRLRTLCEKWSEGLSALWWPAAGGAHTCEFCRAYHAGGNIGVPARALLFVALQMVSHYVESHGYRPPDDFVEAVLSCPTPGTPEYANAVARFREINLERHRKRFPDAGV